MFTTLNIFWGGILYTRLQFWIVMLFSMLLRRERKRFLKRPSLLPAFLSLPLNNLLKVKQLGLYFVAKIVNSCFWSINHGGCIPKIFPPLNKNFWLSRQCQPLKMCSSEQNLVRLYQSWKVLSYQKNSRNTAGISPTWWLEKNSQ